MTQPEVARAVRYIVVLVELDTSFCGELAVVCEHGKHRSVGVAMLVLAFVYYNALLALHNRCALNDALRWLEIGG